MSPEAWIALIGVLGTLFGTLGSSYLTNRAAANREEGQWKRQKYDERRKTLLDACENFSALAMLVAVKKAPESESLVRALARVQVLSPGDIPSKAQSLFNTCQKAAGDFTKAETEEDQLEAMRPVQPAVNQFVAAVHKELELD